jgi:Flp pilus assembly pilin Flp
MMKRFADKKGQSVLEYSILLAVAILVIVGGQVYFKRALHGKWKETSDQIGEQFTTAQTYTVQRTQQSARKETSGVAADFKAGAWSQSQIAATAPLDVGAVGGQLGYTGHETTKSDYVKATRGTGTLGTHGTFDSGKLSEVKLFEDD